MQVNGSQRPLQLWPAYSFPILPAQRSPKTGLEMLASQPALVMYKEIYDVFLMSDHCRDIVNPKMKLGHYLITLYDFQRRKKVLQVWKT